MSFKKIAIIVIMAAVCSFSQVNINSASGVNITSTGGSAKGIYLSSPTSDIGLSAYGGLGGINFLGGIITFRSTYQANTYTQHYGDLSLSPGGYSGYGWLYSAGAWISGDLYVSGNKNFVQPHPTDSTKEIVYVAIEAGEALTLARGSAATLRGEVEITLPEHFSLVTSDSAPVTVLLTPKKAPALLYVKNESKATITVAMKPADYQQYGDVEFSYQATGVRDGFENHEAIRDVSREWDTGAASTAAMSPKKKSLMEKSMKMQEKIVKMKYGNK